MLDMLNMMAAEHVMYVYFTLLNVYASMERELVNAVFLNTTSQADSEIELWRPLHQHPTS